MKIKKLLSLSLASLISLNAFAFTPNISIANNSSKEETTCCDKAEVEKLKKKIDESDELKNKIKLLEKKIKELEKNSSTTELNVNSNVYDKKVKGFLSILNHLTGTVVTGLSVALISVILSAVAGAGTITILVIACVSGLTTSLVKSWIHYLQGYVS